MTYHYGNYWAEIRPVRSQHDGPIRYWQYKIFEGKSGGFLFDGHDADIDSARVTVEGHIALLMSSSTAQRVA